jgi:hypothetical protein
MDLSTFNAHYVALSGATTFAFSNAGNGAAYPVSLLISNGGNYTVTWPSSVKWPGGVAPVLTVGGTDLLAFITHDAGINWRGVVAGKDIK